ncbi:MAG: flagellar biosynthesis protein FlhB [Dehalococcoidales bacterium]|nr:flagellar biosynthesis protein FlhB [Dehalococcoidales bacterium]
MGDIELNNLIIDLQLFAEKTEKPTSKRRQKAAEKGQVVISPEINSVLVLLVAFLAIKAFTPYMIEEWTALTGNLYQMYTKNNFVLDFPNLQAMFIMVLVSSTKVLAPVVGGALVAGLTSSLLQAGFHFNMSMIKFDLGNINPINGLKRLFSPNSLAELVKSFFKIAIIGYVAYSEYTKEFVHFSRLTDMNLRASSAFIGQVTLNVVFKIILWLVILAVADYIFLKWRHEKQLMMSKEEIKEEFKQMEGDPQIRARIKHKQRQMSMARMMQALPKADVVITNPTHFAVALQYDSVVMTAPTVIAKGQDRMALRIREAAREHNIVIVENPPLAQSLFYSAEIGDTVPPELYQAVAEVLAFVYKLKGKI